MTQGEKKRDSKSQAEASVEKSMQGAYGSGGSYGTGGGFDDEADQDPERRQTGTRSILEDDDAVASRSARSAAQQDDEHNAGFEREVDPNDAPPAASEAIRSGDEEQLAAKKRRGSRI